MNVRPAEMAQPVVKIAADAPIIVPNLDAALAADESRKMGLLPMMALGIAVVATVVWNGFLLWKAAAFFFGLIGF